MITQLVVSLKFPSSSTLGRKLFLSTELFYCKHWFTRIACNLKAMGRACAHYVMVSKFQWKPFWLATQRDLQNDWTATQNRVNYDVFAQAPLPGSHHCTLKQTNFLKILCPHSLCNFNTDRHKCVQGLLQTQSLPGIHSDDNDHVIFTTVLRPVGLN